MAYKRFEDLPVWNSALDLGVKVYELAKANEFKGQYSLRDQLERAAVSVSNNIAEGFERGTNGELLTFLYIARGSVAEVRSMFHLLNRLPEFSNIESRLSPLVSLSESISRQLGGWINAVKDSNYQGHRDNTTASRQGDHQRVRRDAFLEYLEQVRNGDVSDPIL